MLLLLLLSSTSSFILSGGVFVETCRTMIAADVDILSASCVPGKWPSGTRFGDISRQDDFCNTLRDCWNRADLCNPDDSVSYLCRDLFLDRALCLGVEKLTAEEYYQLVEDKVEIDRLPDCSVPKTEMSFFGTSLRPSRRQLLYAEHKEQLAAASTLLKRVEEHIRFALVVEEFKRKLAAKVAALKEAALRDVDKERENKIVMLDDRKACLLVARAAWLQAEFPECSGKD